jgi:hypothetical protein
MNHPITILIKGNIMSQVKNATSALNNPMAIATGALVKGKVIGSEIVDLITKGTKKSLDTAKTKSKTVDLMQAQGLKSFDLDLSNKSNTELHNQIKGAIVLGFDLDAQALLAKESKVLSDFEKATKRALGMQIGSEFAYYRRALAKREESAERGRACNAHGHRSRRGAPDARSHGHLQRGRQRDPDLPRGQPLHGE